jgi:hypothetical protein
LVLLDIDVKDPRACGFDTLAALGGVILPDTPMAHTRSGGLHVYFACIDTEIRNSEGKHGLGPGLDVRGEGGFAVVPCPGSGYVWDPHCNFETVALQPAPAWLGHKSKPHPQRHYDGRRRSPQEILDQCCANIRNAGPGEKYRTVRREPFIVGCLVRDGKLDKDLAWHALDAALGALECHADDPDHMWAAAEGAFAEGLDAAPRRPRA